MRALTLAFVLAMGCGGEDPVEYESCEDGQAHLTRALEFCAEPDELGGAGILWTAPAPHALEDASPDEQAAAYRLWACEVNEDAAIDPDPPFQVNSGCRDGARSQDDPLAFSGALDDACVGVLDACDARGSYEPYW